MSASVLLLTAGFAALVTLGIPFAIAIVQVTVPSSPLSRRTPEAVHDSPGVSVHSIE